MTLEKQFNNFLQNVQVQLCSLPFQKKKKKKTWLIQLLIFMYTVVKMFNKIDNPSKQTVVVI